jgi:hypothetical protein
MTTNKRANRQFDANAVIIITSAAAVVQKTALTAIVARAHNPITALLGGPMTKQRETCAGKSLPVSPIIKACIVEFFASRVTSRIQSVISTSSQKN